MRGQVLGVWFGPRSTVAEVRDVTTGTRTATGVVPHRELSDHELDPAAWWRSLALAINRTGEQTFDALSIAGAHPGLVLVDQAGVALRPMQPWTEATTDVARVRQALGMQRWARRAGMVPDATSTITRLAWLRRTDADTFARIGLALAAHEWLIYRLTGRAVTDQGSASESGMWSPHTGTWIPEALDLLAQPGYASTWPRRLPRVAAPSQRADWLTAPVSELLALQGRPVVGPGTGEAMAIALALGLRPGQPAIALTERTAAMTPVDDAITDASGVVRSRAGAEDGHLAVTWEVGGAGLVGSIAALLHLPLAELGALALATAPAEGMVLVPPAEEGTRAVLTGLDEHMSRGSIARATIDGIACAAAGSLDELVAAGARWDDDEPVRLTGPAAALEVHARVLADLLGRPVTIVPGSMAAAGACIQAAAVVHEVAPLEIADTWALGDGIWVEPRYDPTVDDRRAAYARERARQERAGLADR